MREPFQSVATGTALREGKFAEGSPADPSRMNEGGVIVADGIEEDRLFRLSRRVELAAAFRSLKLVSA